MSTIYADKLKDPRWQRRRLEIMERDEFKCTICGNSENALNIHHIYYVSGREPWDYPGFALTTHCEECHRLRQHEAHKAFEAWERIFEDSGLLDQRISELHAGGFKIIP